MIAPVAPSSAIDDFIARTVAGDPQTIAREMGSLTRMGIKPAEFSVFCHGFAEGVSYVKERYGTEPVAILLSDEDSRSPRYNTDTKQIFLPRKFVADWIRSIYASQTKTDPYKLNYVQAAKAYGVEEAFHHYQYTQDPERFIALLKGQTVSHKVASPDYDKQPLEAEAKQVVREALQEFGYEGFEVGKVIFASEPGTRSL